MNKRIKEIQKLATDTRITGFGEIDTVDNEKFAELLIKDILQTVAAQSLLNESALDVFVNLKRIYEEPLEIKTKYIPRSNINDYDF